MVKGIYASVMRMKTSSQTTWRREVLESHLGLSRGTTSARKNLHRPPHHHELAEESFWQDCAEQYGAMCPTTAIVEVVGRNIVFIKGEAIDIAVPFTHAAGANLSRFVEVYIGVRMCTSICAISERNLLHCSLTYGPGHHASRRWIVEKAIAAMHDAMQDDVTNIPYLTTFIALLLDGFDRQRHHINEYAILLVFPRTGPEDMCEVFLGMVDVACGYAQDFTKQLESFLLIYILDRDGRAKRVVTFVVEGASNLGVRGANA